MNRRTALKQALLLTGGVLALPSCLIDRQRVSEAAAKLKLEAEDEELLAGVVGAIIPDTDIPGARELKVHDFVLVMAADCLEKTAQEDFANGLKQVDILAREHLGKGFAALSQTEQETLLEEVAGSGPQEARVFLEKTRQYTIRGYLQSQYIMTEVLPYEMVPGTFNGCIAINQVKITS